MLIWKRRRRTFWVLSLAGYALFACGIFVKFSNWVWWIVAALIFSSPLYVTTRFLGMWLEWMEEAIECDDLANLAKQGSFLLLTREHQDRIRSARKDLKKGLFSEQQNNSTPE